MTGLGITVELKKNEIPNLVKSNHLANVTLSQYTKKVTVHSAFSVITFIFIDALTRRANNEGRRLEVNGAEIERLKKGN